MIQIVEGNKFWEHPTANIVFNPVSVSKSNSDVFNKSIKHKFPEVYREYRGYMIGEYERRLLGDIQLVQVDEKKFIMNAFVYKGNRINIKAVVKTFIELLNLTEEYNISASLLSTLGSKNNNANHEIWKSINNIFGDSKSDIYVYKKKINK